MGDIIETGSRGEIWLDVYATACDWFPLVYIYDLVQDCSISNAIAMEKLQSDTKLSVYQDKIKKYFIVFCKYIYVKTYTILQIHIIV